MLCNDNFVLDDRLNNDSVFVALINGCYLHLSKDARYPWLILIPGVHDTFELDDLDFDDQIEVLKVSNLVSGALKQVFSPHKLNVAAIGNIVKQLHIHHVARFEYDEAWPAPIWGAGEALSYSSGQLNARIAAIREALTTINKGELDVNYHHKQR